MKSEQTLTVEVQVRVSRDTQLVRHRLRLLGEQLRATAEREISALPDGMVELETFRSEQTCEPEHEL